jgi:hypothetical protein
MHRRRLPCPLGIPALAACILLLAGCSGDSEPRTTSSVIAPNSTQVRASATGRPITAGRLVVSEFHDTYTLLLSVSADNPADRRPVVRIDHAPNWSPRAAVAPGGDRIAYVVLPAGARSPDTEGTLWVVGLTDRDPKRLAQRLDARTVPVWTPDGTRVVYQRAVPGAGGTLSASLEELEIATGKATELITETPPTRLFPISYAPDGVRFYFARFTREGAFLNEVNTSTRAARQIVRLADGAARDFRLTPTGDQLLYLALGSAPVSYKALAVDLSKGAVLPVLPGVNRTEDVGVAWKPGSPAVATVGIVTAGGDQTGRIDLDQGMDTTVTQTAQGFDVPVAWSPDGRFLFARSFSGRSADDPGREQPVLIDSEGVRRPLGGDGPVDFVGWATNAP